MNANICQYQSVHLITTLYWLTFGPSYQYHPCIIVVSQRMRSDWSICMVFFCATDQREVVPRGWTPNVHDATHHQCTARWVSIAFWTVTFFIYIVMITGPMQCVDLDVHPYEWFLALHWRDVVQTGCQLHPQCLRADCPRHSLLLHLVDHCKCQLAASLHRAQYWCSGIQVIETIKTRLQLLKVRSSTIHKAKKEITQIIPMGLKYWFFSNLIPST